MDEERKPCGRKAEWFVIGEVLDGGNDFIVTCRECYQKGLGRISPATPEDVVPARVFQDVLGRELMCEYHSDWNPEINAAIKQKVELVEDVPLSRPEFSKWVVRRDLSAKIHRIAIHRRFQRVEQSVGILTTVASVAIALQIADGVKKWLSFSWAWPVSFVAAYLLLDRLIRLGRFRKYANIK